MRPESATIVLNPPPAADLTGSLELVPRLDGQGYTPAQVALRPEAEATTRPGRLLRVECSPIGREVIVHFRFYTADAHGMNMIVKAADRACAWAMRKYPARRYYTFSGHSSEKRASGALFRGGKGKPVVAGARLPAAV